MSTQTYREPTDATKRRRKYLRKKWIGISVAIFSMGIYACTAFYSLIAVSDLVLSTPQHEWPDGARTAKTLLIIIPLSVLALLAYRFSHSAMKKVKVLPYVAPIREQIGTLPAEEILLRGTVPPPATTNELLRAARPVTDVCAGELLRAEPEKPEQGPQQKAEA